ncbi:N-acetylmuramoyl-L-alanine amidase [Streptomyces sp. I05A-00742]|uniref:N-acetylmuramoyl-L-alanine amidase n=1 Tax=Streptomyces sp. I05A-00742 TaxID=2732853 RepID=UPI002016B4E4|nr:N-acetylmuramoyl-L-alanine amidase [Streptomyces sp. I05A-00742]
MRGILVTSAVTACAATLTLPFLAAPGAASSPERRAAAAQRGIPGATYSLPLVPLEAGDGTGTADHGRSRAGAVGAGVRGLRPQRVKPFSLVGIVWDNAGTELRGRAQVRTRSMGTGTWSGWQDVQVHDHDRPDLGTAEARAARRGSTAPLWVGASDAVEVRVRPNAPTGRQQGPTPLPRGMRVELVDPGAEPGHRARGRAISPSAPAVPTAPAVPSKPAAPSPDDREHASSAANAPLAPLGAHEIPASSGRPASAAEVAAITAVGPGATASSSDTGEDGPGGGNGEAGERSGADEDASAAEGGVTDGTVEPTRPATDPSAADPAEPPRTEHGRPSEDSDDALDSAADEDNGSAAYAGYAGPRPRIVTRAGWGADESIRERGFVYAKKVKAAFVHHTASGNGYTCAQSASVIRGIYRYHVVSSGWRDIGYNFLIDKCGTVYEGRAGGVAKPVRGAHTLGFNTDSMGIAVLGTFGKTNPATAAVNAVAALSAWKLGLWNANPRGTTTLVSAGGNLFKKGAKVKLKVISGHRDGYSTECPGDRLYSKLGTARSAAARLQGR